MLDGYKRAFRVAFDFLTVGLRGLGTEGYYDVIAQAMLDLSAGLDPLGQDLVRDVWEELVKQECLAEGREWNMRIGRDPD